MADDLLPYYNRELTQIRRLAAEFADAHPKIAGRLRVSRDAVEDPHVARLIEAFAFLNARVRRKLDDDFPELTDALLDVLYPHYLAPTPSMAIARFQAQPDLAGSFELPAGSQLETEPVAGEPCRYRTAYPVTLWPIEVASATLAGRPLVAPANPAMAQAASCLRLTLRGARPDVTFTGLGLDRLRFFLAGQPQHVHALYELILNDTISVAFADGANDRAPVIVGPEAIRPVGFERDEGVLPFPARSFIGYRLLTEYFSFPEKFLFFDLDQIARKTLMNSGNSLEVFFYLRRTSIELERSVSAANFQIGCTPIVNLFRQRAEPIHLSHATSEYRVVPDARRPHAMEVHSIRSVVAGGGDEEPVTFSPFYGLKHAGPGSGGPFWHAGRRDLPGGQPGTEMFLSFVDPDFAPTRPARQIVSVETECTNRDLPSLLPFGGGHPVMQLVAGSAAVASVTCVTPPTPTIRAPKRHRGRWRLISHLSLNHLSLVGGEDGVAALREILRLYDFRDTAETRAILDGIVSVEGALGVARVGRGAESAVCRGMDVSLTFDADRFSGAGLYLLASVLERFLALYGSINSFTRMTARIAGRPGMLKQWPARAGDKILL